MPKDDVIKLLRHYIDLLENNKISIVRAFLYGSYLNNTATDESDIDLMLVSKSTPNDSIIGKIWRLTTKIDTKIEPIIVDETNFTNSNSPLIDYVKEFGLEIYPIK